MSWTTSAARRARAWSSPSACSASRSRRSRLKTTSSAPAAVAARSRNQAAQQREAEVEDLGAAPAARPFRLVGDVAGAALDAGRLLLLERLARRVLDAPSRRPPPSSAGASRAPRRSRPRSPPRRSARPRRGARAHRPRAGARARSRSPAARRAAAATSSGSPAPLELGLDGLDRERRELDRLAARGDVSSSAAGSELSRIRWTKLGRLLERLQQRVLALVAHRLGRLDDEDAACRPRTGGRRRRGSPARGPPRPCAGRRAAPARRGRDAARDRAERDAGRRRGHRRRRRGSRPRRPGPRPACRPRAGPRNR